MANDSIRPDEKDKKPALAASASEEMVKLFTQFSHAMGLPRAKYIKVLLYPQIIKAIAEWNPVSCNPEWFDETQEEIVKLLTEEFAKRNIGAHQKASLEKLMAETPGLDSHIKEQVGKVTNAFDIASNEQPRKKQRSPKTA